MAIPLTGPISLGDMKNDTAAPTASFDEPMIRRRYVSADGFKYGDQLPSNTQMSLGDFRGSVLTLERDFAGAASDVNKPPQVGLQTHVLVRDDAGVYGSSGISLLGGNPQYRKVEVLAQQAFARDVAVGMTSCGYVPPSLLPASVNLTVYQVSDNDAQRTILAVNCWSSGYLKGDAVQPIWKDPVQRGVLHNINFNVPLGYPYVTVFFIQVTRGSMAFESCRVINDRQSGTNQNMKVMNVRLV
jgi:hypothetical protein